MLVISAAKEKPILPQTLGVGTSIMTTALTRYIKAGKAVCLARKSGLKTLALPHALTGDSQSPLTNGR